MKKLALLFLLFAFAFISYGQNTALDVKSLKGNFNTTFDIKKNVTYRYYYGVAADTITEVDSLWNYDFAVENLLDNLNHEFRIKLDSVSGAPEVLVTLQGKWSYNDAYTDIGSATWTGTTSDTTIAISNTTSQGYRFLNISLDGTDTAQESKVNYLELGVSED